jgi:hypothetical protein
MGYLRVIPRDLFNEASLLKCLGRLAIVIDTVRGQPAHFAVESVEDFRITQDESDGSIYAGALPFVISGKHYHLSRPLNSREPWPLYCSRGDDVWQVFDDYGRLTKEFSDLLMAEVKP